MKNKHLNKALKRLKKFTWVLCVLMFMQSCLFKNPAPLIVGIMFFMYSFLFFPWEEKIYQKIKIKLTKKNKMFMIFIIFIITCIFLHPKKITYYDAVLSFLFSSLSYFIMILYIKNKHKK